MKYMLDTNIIIYARNNEPAKVLNRFRRHEISDFCISAITMAELEYGVCNSSKPEQNRGALMAFLSGIKVLPFDAKAAAEYGRIRHQLKQTGRMIGANDLLIAAHAKATDMTLITNNLGEFNRVPGLKTDNWT